MKKRWWGLDIFFFFFCLRKSVMGIHGRLSWGYHLSNKLNYFMVCTVTAYRYCPNLHQRIFCCESYGHCQKVLSHIPRLQRVVWNEIFYLEGKFFILGSYRFCSATNLESVLFLGQKSWPDSTPCS